MIDFKSTEFSGNFTPQDFTIEAKASFETVYSPGDLLSLEQDSPDRYNALDESRHWFEEGDRQAGWDALEGGLAEAGWTDKERDLSIKIVGAEEDCGLQQYPDSSEELNIPMGVLEEKYPAEAATYFHVLKTETDNPVKARAIEALLQKVEHMMGEAITAKGDYPATREQLRIAQHALYLKKFSVENSYEYRYGSENPANTGKEKLSPVDFAYSAREVYKGLYGKYNEDTWKRLEAQPDEPYYTAIRNARWWHESGATKEGRDNGWNDLEGWLAKSKTGWTDTERELSVRLTAAGRAHGIEFIGDESTDINAALKLLEDHASPETRELLDQYNKGDKVQAIDGLLRKIEAGMAKVIEHGNSPVMRQRLRAAQQALYLEKKSLISPPDLNRRTRRR